MGNCLGLCELFSSPDRLRVLRHSPAIYTDPVDGINSRTTAKIHQQKSKYRHGKACKDVFVGPVTVLEEATDDVKLHYDLGPELGRGQFGVIRFCKNKRTGENFACKSIAKGRLFRPKDVNDVRREIQIMKQLVGHPNIVELKDVYEDHTWVHLIMELCEGGELFDSIVHRKVFSEKEAAAICKTMMEALAYCHKHGVLHRDLKPENILLTKDSEHNNVVKLADFGLAVNIRPGEKICGMAGSAYYIAPEVLKGEYGEEVDVWSAGVVLYILLSGVPPFWGDTEESIFNAIRFGRLDLSSDPWPNVSAAAKDLIKGMLRQEIKKRLTPEQVLSHRWIVQHTESGDSEASPANPPVDTIVSCSWITETNSFASFYSDSEVRDYEIYASSPSASQSLAPDALSWPYSHPSKSKGCTLHSSRAPSRSCTTDAVEDKPAEFGHDLYSLPEIDGSPVDVNIVLSSSTQDHSLSGLEESMNDVGDLSLMGVSCARLPGNNRCTRTSIETAEVQQAILVDTSKESLLLANELEQERSGCKLVDEKERSLVVTGSAPSDRLSWSPYSLDAYLQTQLQVAC